MASEAEIWDLDLTVGQALAKVVACYPQREAIIFGDERISYQQLGERVQALAAALHQLGLPLRSKIAVIMPSVPETMYAQLAIGEAGHVLVPVNPNYPIAELRPIFQGAEVAAAIVQPDILGQDVLGRVQALRAELPGLKHVIVHGDVIPEGTLSLRDMLARRDLPAPPPGIAGPHDLYMLLYTSGTTGGSKGVMHSHHNVLANTRRATTNSDVVVEGPALEAFRARYGARFARYAGHETWMTPLALFGAAGISISLHTLLLGFRLVMMEQFHPVRALELIEREHVNALKAAPSMYAVMLDAQDFARYDRSSLLLCEAATAHCPPELARRMREGFDCLVSNPFGASEIGTLAFSSHIGDPIEMQETTVGQAVPGMEARIVNDDQQEQPPGEVGELLLRCDGLMLGYYNAPELTAKVLDPDGWYHTGDLATRNEQGYFRIVGRKKDMIVRGGQNVYPIEIENLLQSKPGVRAVAVVGVPSPSKIQGEQTWAFVVPEPGVALTAKDVMSYCRGQLAAFKMPDVVRIVDCLPLTGTGKVQKFALREMALKEANPT